MKDIFDEVFTVIEDRKKNPKQDSYVTSLFKHKKGTDKILEKVGEESTELIIAAKSDKKKDIIHEAADLFFHTMVLLAAKGLKLKDIREELRRRRH